MNLDTLLTLAVQSTIVLLLASLGDLALRKASAASRHAVWAAAFAVLLLIPVLPQNAWLAYTQALPVPQAITRTSITVVGTRAPEWNWAKLALLLYCLGIVAVLLRAVFNHLALCRLARGGNLPVPMVLGLLRPKIHLPSEASAWQDDLRACVIAHEQQHIERLDLWWQLFSLLATALYWPHPLVWWARKRLIDECEQACDDAVLALGVPPTRYAQDLLTVARNLSHGTNHLSLEGGLAMTRTNQLEERIRFVLDPLQSRGVLTRRTLSAVALCALALLLPLSGYRLLAQAQEPGLEGTILDPSGAPIADVRVTVSQGNRKEITRTNASGNYRFPSLPAGEWDISLRKPGFAAFEARGVTISPEGAKVFSTVLHLGKISETVQVSANATPNPSILRVGGNVMSAKLVNRVAPKYPPDCKSEGVQGTVLLKAIIAKDGSIISLTPINQIVDVRLQREAIQAVQQWRYQPTLLNGKEVEIQTEIEVNFTLAP